MAAGDERAIGPLYDRYGAIAFGLATAMTESPSAAEAVVADAFAKLWRGAQATAVDRVEVLTWLTSIVRSLALARYGSGRRLSRAPGPMPAVWPTLAASPGDRVGAVAMKDELSPTSPIAIALAALSDPQWRAVELAYFRGLSWREIAVELRLPESSVALHLRSALDTLRPALSLRPAGPEPLRIAHA